MQSLARVAYRDGKYDLVETDPEVDDNIVLTQGILFYVYLACLCFESCTEALSEISYRSLHR